MTNWNKDKHRYTVYHIERKMSNIQLGPATVKKEKRKIRSITKYAYS